MHKVFEEILSNPSTPDTKSFTEKWWSYFYSVRFLKNTWVVVSLAYTVLWMLQKYRKDPLLMQYCLTKLFEIAVKFKYPATRTTEYTAEDTRKVSVIMLVQISLIRIVYIHLL